jgi:hypothetical protein
MTEKDPFTKQDRLSDLIETEQNSEIKEALKIAIDQDINITDAENIVFDTKKILIRGKLPESSL